MGGGGPSTTTQVHKTEIPKELKPLYTQTGQYMIRGQQQLPLWGTASTPNFFAANPLRIAPLNALHVQGLSQISDLGSIPIQDITAFNYALLAPRIGAMTPSAEDLASSPVIQAQQRAFEQLVMPQIQNQMSLAGLGDSTTLGNILAQTAAGMMVPLFQDELARRERAIERASQLAASLVPQLGALGGAETARRQLEQQAWLQGGDIVRNISQAANVAAYEDFLRRQGLSEALLFGPLGQLPTTFGSVATSTTRQGGGLFGK